jgi:dinuclear metal center YbgI/SA1388 family protein
MNITIQEITKYLESLAPKSSQESYDNSGLILGDSDRLISKVLICLDSIESIVDEAIELGCELIIAHHPIIFKGLKSLTGKNYVERVIIKCIQNNIALYAIHTNLDNYRLGVNKEIGKRLGLINLKILAPKSDVLRKLVILVPEDNAAKLTNALFEAGAGQIGNYSECSFASVGVGTFNPSEDSKPHIGTKGKREKVIEEKLEVLVSIHNLANVLQAMKANHPYEEVAHDILLLGNENQFEGAGMIGELKEEMDELKFLKKVKKDFKCGIVRHTALRNKKIKKVAFCGGSGSFLLSNAKNQQADIFITGDFKYHEFFDSDNQIVIADIGHYESEQFTINLLGAILTEKFPNFAVHLTGYNTNPIKYL